MQNFFTNAVIKRTSCTDLAVLHSYHIFSKDQLWRDSDRAWGSCQTSYIEECSTLPPDDCKQKNSSNTDVRRLGVYFQFQLHRWLKDSTPKKKKKSTCIKIQMHASLGGCTGRGQAPSDPYRGTPGATKASQESLLKIYIYLWTRFLYLLRFNLSINCTNVTAVGHWTPSSGCQSRP